MHSRRLPGAAAYLRFLRATLQPKARAQRPDQRDAHRVRCRLRTISWRGRAAQARSRSSLARLRGLAGELRYPVAPAGSDHHCPARAMVTRSRAQTSTPADTEARELSSVAGSFD